MRKVLSFVLVLTLVLSSFSMAFAADTAATPAAETPATTAATTATPAATTATTAVTAGLSDISASGNSQAIEVCNNLGIVTGNPDGTFQPEKSVNRAEFAAMITRALGIPASALAGYTSTSFKDTSGYGWAVSYLAFCQSKGIMLGDGAGNAMPGRTINTNEAATMILRALGYTANSSQLVGVWPSNYVSLAQDLGIYDNTSTATNVDKQNAAQMIYNALSVQKVQVAADGTTTFLVGADDEPVTMLTSGLGCDSNGYGIVQYDADAVIGTVAHVGEYAKTYDNADGDLIAIDDIQSTAMTGTFNDEDSSNTLTADDTFTVDDVDYTINALTFDDDEDAATPVVGYDTFVNGDADAIAFEDGYTYTFNVRLSNKKTVELFSVEEWTPSAAEKIVAGDLEAIKDGTFLGFDFATDKKDNIITKSFELVGAKSLSDIKADSVVYVYNNADGRDEITKVAVGTAVVEGKVTKVNGTDDEWTIGGKVYGFAGTTGSDAYDDQLNNEVKAYLDANGDIYQYDVTSGSAKDYAVILGMDTIGTAKGNMKLYLADDSKKTYSSDFDEWDWVAANANSDNNSHRLIGYGLDKDGVIDGVYPDENPATVWTTGSAVFKSNTVVSLNGDKVVSKDVVVFTEEADGDITGVAKIADVDKDTAITGVEALIRENEVVALIVNEDKVSGSGDSQYAVISDADSAVNPAGDKAQLLTGYIDGTKMAADTVYTSGTSTVDDWETVHLYQIKYNDDKNISKADIQYATVTDEAITATGYVSDGYIKIGPAGVTAAAIADGAKFYEVVFETVGNEASGIDKYKPYNGTIYAGMDVWMYDTDDDEAGAEVVIIDKNGVSAYTAPTFNLVAIDTNITGAAVTTVAGIGINYYDDSTLDPTDDFTIAVEAGSGLDAADFDVVVDGSGDLVLTCDPGDVTTDGTYTVTLTLEDVYGYTVDHTIDVTFE